MDININIPVCPDNKSFLIVEGEGFKYMVRQMVPLYKIPTRNTIKMLIDKKYEVVQKHFFSGFTKC